MDTASDIFARAFGDALRSFLESHQITCAEAARRMGMEKATLNTYLHDSPRGKRRKARVEVIFEACARLGFSFQYNGYRIRAESLVLEPRAVPATTEQFSFDFHRQFNLTEDNGLMSVRLKREPGQVELTVALKVAS